MSGRPWCCALAMLLAPATALAQPYAFASNAAAESVAVVDVASDTVVGTVPLAGRPTGAALTLDGRRLFVARTGLNALAMIDTATGAVTPIAVGTAPSAVAVAPGQRRVYVANTGDDTLSVVDAVTGAVAATIPVGAAPVAVAAGGARVYVANWAAHSVSVVDAIGKTVVATVDVGTFPAGLVLHRGRLYVASFGNDTVSVIDATTLSPVATVPVSRRPRALALDPVAGRLYVAGFEDALIDVIDTATNTVALRAPSGGLNPTDLMLGPGGQRLYVSHLEAGQPLRVLDAATLAQLAAIDAPSGPVALAGFSEHAPPLDAGPGRLRSALEGLLSRPGSRGPVRQRPVRPLRAPDDAVIFDGEFDPAEWFLFIANGLSLTSQEPTGGNPGAWRNTVHLSGPVAVETWHQYLGDRFDPQTGGAVGWVDVTWDRKVAGEVSVNEAVVVVQDGHAYRTNLLPAFVNPTWAGAGASQLTQFTFSDSEGNHPDFSASGESLFFGYYRRTPVGFTVGHGIDNFRVVVHAGLAGLLAFRDSLVLTESETENVTIERVGGAQGNITALVRVMHPRGDVTHQTILWLSGDDDPIELPVQILLHEGGGAQTARLSLVNPTGGASVAADRGEMTMIHRPAGWPPEMLAMFLAFEALLAAFSPAWLLALAGASILVALLRRRRGIRARLALGIAAAVTAGIVFAGCDRDIDSTTIGLNQRLRPDRAPLDGSQRRITLATLALGPYRVSSGDLATPIVPASAETGLIRQDAGGIRQSDCWWMAQGAEGNGDAVKARWESIVELAGDVADTYEDPEDSRLELGMCRLNDPETRNPLRNRDGQDVSMEVDCSRLGDRPVLNLPSDANLPLCTSDTVMLQARLEAFATDAADPFRECEPLLGTFTRRARVISRGTDFFDGPSAGAGDQTRVAACSAAQGNTLRPRVPTRYRVWLPGNVTQWLDPVLFPVQENAVLGRPMAGDGTSWTWSTPTTGPGPTRWRENFSPALRVKSAALFVVGTGGVKSYVNATPAPQLCIEDRDFGGSGCRWSCDDVDPNDGRLSYDLRAPHKCRNASGTEEVPTVNPTAAPLNLALFAQASPLAWRVSNVPSPQLWIEFTLDHTLPAFGLTGAPPLIDMGGARVGEGLRGAFVVHNSGQHPTRVTAVAMAPPGGGSPHSADFVPQLPVAPQPVPLPVEVVSVASKETTIRIRPDAERELLHRLHRDSVLARVAPRGQGFSETIDGHVVTERDGLLTRDAVNARFIHDVAKQPAVRVTYAFRTPPFVVQPGESFEVSVRGTPSATGDRVAEVRVTGESVLDPTRRAEVRVLVKLFGMQGPLLSVQPGTANVYVDQGAGHARQRTLLIQNAGDVAGVLGAPLLRGRGGAALPANSPFSLEDPYASWGSLGATEFREVRVRFVSACGASPGYREDDAEVRWSTADGPLVVPVHGTTYCAP